MSKGNFKVMCVSGVGNGTFTKGKVYEVKNGVITWDNGKTHDKCDTIDMLNDQFYSQFKMLNGNKSITRIQKITVKQKGRKVIAILSENGKFIKAAKARYNPNDEFEGKPFDFEIGKSIAIKRLLDEDVKNITVTLDWDKVAEAVKKATEAVKKIPLTENGFKVGDRVEVIEQNNYAKIGSKGIIYELSGGGASIKFDNGDEWWLFNSRFKLLNLGASASPIDWQAFKSGKIAVHCDTEEKAREFLKECDEKGILWNGGEQASSETNYNHHGSDTCYCNYMMNKDKIGFSSVDYYREEGIDIIDYAPSKPTVKEVKRPAKVGEWIKIVKSQFPRNNYNVGDIYRVLEVDEFGYIRIARETEDDDVYNWVTKSDEYVVLENYQPEEPKPFRKAKVGDKIRIVKDIGGHGPEIEIGDIHIVKYVYNDGVQTDKGNVFYDNDQEYIIIEEAPEDTEIKVGDAVKVINDGAVCSTYRKFIEMYAREFSSKYSLGYTPKNGSVGVVVGKGKHEIYGKDYYAVLANDKVFCIGEKGIEKVK